MGSTDQVATEQRRSVFLSHRHEDREIADIFRRFIDRVGGGRVDVFQSSYEGGGPEVGLVLNEELGDQLRRAEVVLVIYTVADANWSYCMWEAGVAFNPAQPDTRIVVVQCTDAAPAPLSDRVRVLAHDGASLGQFVVQFMTSPSFFPRHEAPLTEFTAEHEAVQRASATLLGELTEIAVGGPDRSWPAWPMVVLEYPLESEAELREAVAAEDVNRARELLLQQCQVTRFDKYAPPVFGWPSLEAGTPLADLVSRMPDVDGQPAWLESLLSQLASAVAWDFPKCPNAHLVHRRQNTRHLPLLTNVTRSPRKKMFELVVMFPEATTDTN